MPIFRQRLTLLVKVQFTRVLWNLYRHPGTAKEQSKLETVQSKNRTLELLAADSDKSQESILVSGDASMQGSGKCFIVDFQTLTF